MNRPRTGFAFLLVSLTLLLAACGAADEPLQSEPVSNRAAVMVDREYEVNGLSIRVGQLIVEPGRILVDLRLENVSEGMISFLGGACGPSQGKVHTDGHRFDVFYTVGEGDDLSGKIPPGGVRNGIAVLKYKHGGTVSPADVLGVELHPGYVMNNATLQVEFFETEVALRELHG